MLSSLCSAANFHNIPSQEATPSYTISTVFFSDTNSGRNGANYTLWVDPSQMFVYVWNNNSVIRKFAVSDLSLVASIYMSYNYRFFAFNSNLTAFYTSNPGDNTVNKHDFNSTTNVASAPTAVITLADRWAPGVIISRGSTFYLCVHHSIQTFTESNFTLVLLAGGPGPYDYGSITNTTLLLARFNAPQGLAFDSSGILYCVDYVNTRIQKIDILGNMVTTVQTGVPNPSFGIAFNTSDEYFFQGANYIYRSNISTPGEKTIIAGTGTAASTGDGGSPMLADLNGPGAICVLPDGSILFAEGSNFTTKIRKLSPPPALL